MKTIKLFISTLALLLPSIIWCQSSRDYTPNIVTPAPTVAGLLKYAEIPVNNYNGTASFSVPIYDLKEGDLDLPITLSYYSNGLKTEEDASWVGLGWSLNAGGVIQWIHSDQKFSDAKIEPINFTNNPDGDPNEGNYVLNRVYRGCNFQNEAGEPVVLNPASDIKTMGYEYDYFLFNFAGYSGKCIMDRDHNIVSIDNNNIKFQQLDGRMVATTPDGNVYTFAQVGTNCALYKVGGPCANATGSTCDTSYTYYLTQITSPTNSTINFTYEENLTRSIPHLSQSAVHVADNQSVLTTKTYTAAFTSIKEYVLTEINTVNLKVRFNKSPRIDVYNGQKLDNVEVFAAGSTVSLKKIRFNYDYFTGLNNFGDFIAQDNTAGFDCIVPSPFVALEIRSKRMKLLSVEFTNNVSSSFNPKYAFDYNTATPMPYKTSMAQDLWGYFNGISNSTLLPNVNALGYYDNTVPLYFYQYPQNGLRQSNEVYMKAGMLTKVTQPTGGYSEITYEINKFDSLPTTANNVVQAQAIVEDHNSNTTKAVTFTIPNILGQNQKLSVALVCNAHVPCDQDTSPTYCAPYFFPSSGSQIHPNDNRLYALLEKNVNGVWSEVDSFSNTTPALVTASQYQGTCGIYDKVLNLQPGQYRMTVNYPDNMAGFLGGPWAQMKMTYLDNSTATYSNQGAGLRVKSIADFTDATHKYNEKKYTYTGGTLVTKPVFYRRSDMAELLAVTEGYNYTTQCPTIISPIDIQCSVGQTGTNGTIVYPYPTDVLTSDPTLPYSMNAQGNLVGYSNVNISYGTNGDETYKYKNDNDFYFYYGSMLPGIPAGRKLYNGMLTEKITRKLDDGGQPAIVKSETFQYETKNIHYYWAFKQDYMRNLVNCPGYQTPMSTPDINYNFIHFYPIKTGKVRIKSKTETDYSSSAIPTVVAAVTTDYSYNTKNQLVSERYTNSQNEVIEHRTYYPSDMLTDAQQSVQMQQLVDSNRLELPIKSEDFVAGIQVREKVTRYNNNATTGGLMLQTEVHTLKGTNAIDVTSTENRKITLNKYETDGGLGNGNVLEYTLENGTPVAMIWGYNKTQPIAKLENVAYASIPTATILDLQAKSNADHDNCNLPGCGEATLIAALNNLRIAFPAAFISTYTYDPLVGITSITDAKGDTVYYKYDPFDRLQYVKDRDNNVLSENSYHYKQ